MLENISPFTQNAFSVLKKTVKPNMGWVDKIRKRFFARERDLAKMVAIQSL